MRINIIILFTLGLIQVSCGGSGSNSKETVDTPQATPILYTGVFLDSAVEGLNYATTTQTGVTNNTGEFTYQLNETVVFAIGNIQFTEVLANSIITPLDIFTTENINQTSVINMLRLLQSLDEDGEPKNGIKIPAIAHDFADNLKVDFSSSEFDNQVADLIAMSDGINQQLITAEDAISHFQNTLSTLNTQDMGNCTKSHTLVGYSGFFETFAHNVAGKATIIDDCTILISQFDYDGQGPEVYFYGAREHQYQESSAFLLGPKLNGQTYQNDEFTIRLPTNRTLDDLTGLSVWCVDFNADFGHMEFTP